MLIGRQGEGFSRRLGVLKRDNEDQPGRGRVWGVLSPDEAAPSGVGRQIKERIWINSRRRSRRELGNERGGGWG